MIQQILCHTATRLPLTVSYGVADTAKCIQERKNIFVKRFQRIIALWEKQIFDKTFGGGRFNTFTYDATGLDLERVCVRFTLLLQKFCICFEIGDQCFIRYQIDKSDNLSLTSSN